MNASETIATAIAVLSLVISASTAWLTLFKRGRLRMTRPNIIGFAKDGFTPKLFLRFLLHSTARRGNLVEDMYVILVKGSDKVTLSIWGYGDSQQSLVRGSGLFVGPAGVAVNHHFIARSESDSIVEAGPCVIQVYASIAGKRRNQLLYSVELNIEDNHAREINSGNQGMLYDWDAESRQYYPQMFMREPTFEDLSTFERRKY
ncbi:MAG TPA: hypothetical protein VGJ55_09465 [Pyrinomonadaceae bacterium]|jgi:hypothetical protein